MLTRGAEFHASVGLCKSKRSDQAASRSAAGALVAGAWACNATNERQKPQPQGRKKAIQAVGQHTKQAAGQIVETVVREKEQFSYCIEYLNKLHPDRKLQKEKKKKEKQLKTEKLMKEKANSNYPEETFDRYSY